MDAPYIFMDAAEISPLSILTKSNDLCLKHAICGRPLSQFYIG